MNLKETQPLVKAKSGVPQVHTKSGSEAASNKFGGGKKGGKKNMKGGGKMKAAKTTMKTPTGY